MDPGDNHPLLAHIPDRESKHPVQMIQYLVAPLLIPVNDDFRVGLGSEYVSETFQLTLQLWKVVDFTVENHPNGFFPIGHGLMTAREINDREPAKTEPERSGEVVTLVVRPTMGDTPGHPL